MDHNEKAVKILEKYFKEIYESLDKEWTEENETDMKNIIRYLNENLPKRGTVLEVLDNGEVWVKLDDGTIRLADTLSKKK